MEQGEFQTLLRFFKALANENRLKILGLLANRECSVGEVATLLELKEPTISHHLGKLKGAGLVEMRVVGNDHLYRLNASALEGMSREILSSEKMGALVGDIEYDAWERKVLDVFLEGDRITAIPTGYKKRLVILKWLVSHFEEDVQYSEKQVNEIIQRHNPDYCTFRREFIDNNLMERESGVYWRIAWQMPEF